MNVLLDNLFARRPKIHYVCPPICGLVFSPTSSGAPAVSFEPVEALGCVEYSVVDSTLSWPEVPDALCYNVYFAPPNTTTYLLIDGCATVGSKPLTETGNYLATAVTAEGETPFCAPVFFEAPPVPPVPPVIPTECVNYYLVNTTGTASDFTWDVLAGATGYNIYTAPSADPTNFSLAYSDVSAPAIFPIDCQLVKVSALNEAGEGPANCPPIEFCYTPPMGQCGPITNDPGELGAWAWFKADSYDPSTPNETLVGLPGTEWIDQSGNGRHATTFSNTPGVQPEYRTNAFGTMPGILIGYQGQKFLKFPIFSPGMEFTVVAVTTPAQTTTSVVGRSFVVGLDGTAFFQSSNRYGFNAQLSDPICYGGRACRTLRRSADGIANFKENLIDRGSFLVAATVDFDWIGAFRTFTSAITVGENYIGELLIFNRYLPDEELAPLVENYLRPRWCFVDCAAPL